MAVFSLCRTVDLFGMSPFPQSHGVWRNSPFIPPRRGCCENKVDIETRNIEDLQKGDITSCAKRMGGVLITIQKTVIVCKISRETWHTETGIAPAGVEEEEGTAEVEVFNKEGPMRLKRRLRMQLCL